MEGPEGSVKERTPDVRARLHAARTRPSSARSTTASGPSARRPTRRPSWPPASTPSTPARPTPPATSTPRRPRAVLQVRDCTREGHDRRRRGGRRVLLPRGRHVGGRGLGEGQRHHLQQDRRPQAALRHRQAQALARQDPAAHQGHRALRGRPRVDRPRGRQGHAREVQRGLEVASSDAKPKDSEKALDLKGDDGANVQGFELVGEAKLELLKGGIAVLSRQRRAAEGLPGRRGQRPHRRGRGQVRQRPRHPPSAA